MEKIRKDALPMLARKVLAQLTPKGDRATLLTLAGDLGAGKTTFVQALGQELGIKETMQSPTYVLMKKYELAGQPFHTLIHLDLYRLATKEEFATLAPETFLKSPGTLVCIEWPERVGDALPKADLELKFSAEDASEGERYFSMDPE
jgi:tRNA threonylcarbamoyladenosine biosynthesis protein TsaE